ncbi:MAG TPA: asparagine synthase-related protein [Bacteroidales bacterium]|nr:asparagine synthase-related protein [Bacteroidales bacterium]
MISGTLLLSSDNQISTPAFPFRQDSSDSGLIFKPVRVSRFIGGYFLHSALPYTDDDFYFFSREDDILVLLSGSVYNTGELLSGHDKEAQLSLPCMIASLFLAEGPAFAGRLNGDFAIFIYRPGKNKAYLFRDHLGIRPMAWARAGETLYFSSDINALCKSLAGGRPAEENYLLGYFKYTDRRITPNRNVYKLHPGHCISFSGKETKIMQYWHPGMTRMNTGLTVDQMFSSLNSLFDDAVKIRCDRRFVAGAHVSGGLDSGIVAALARRYYKDQERFCGFSWSPKDYFPDEVKYDERNLVRSTCTTAGIEPFFSEVTAGDLLGDLASHTGSPWIFYENGTVKKAASYGVNLIFSGWGGDEFISTGDRGIEQDLLRKFRFGLFFRRNPLRPFRKFVRNQLRFVIMPALGILDRSTVSSFRDDARYLKKRYKRSDAKALSDFYFHRSRRQMHLKMLDFYHIQKRCEEWMINGYRRGVEYRYPLLDRRIVEFLMAVPTELLVKAGDYRPLLREMGRSLLPEDVRMNYGKNDPVSRSYTEKIYRDTAMRLTDEVAEWRSNPDISFFDFDLLSEDIQLFRESDDQNDAGVLFKGMVYIKAVHEFTRRYREN